MTKFVERAPGGRVKAEGVVIAVCHDSASRHGYQWADAIVAALNAPIPDLNQAVKAEREHERLVEVAQAMANALAALVNVCGVVTPKANGCAALAAWNAVAKGRRPTIRDVRTFKADRCGICGEPGRDGVCDDCRAGLCHG